MMKQNNNPQNPLDLATVRERLAHTNGRQYWRSLEEAGESEEFREFVSREFPRYASEMRDPATRRNFLKLMGASLALAGLSGCAYSFQLPDEKIVPYVRLPEGMIPGLPLFFATSMPFSGYTTGLVVESHEGRPTKIEGNPNHPASLGATDTFTQASILTMYDPDRSTSVRSGEQESDWETFLAELAPALDEQRASQGEGMRLLTGPITSPTLVSQIQALLEEFPSARWDQYEPVNRDNVREGARLAFGEDIDTRYQFDVANVIVSLDSDFLVSGPGNVRYARDFAAQRRVGADKQTMNRLYAVESSITSTGSMADHRWRLRPSQTDLFTRVLAQRLGVEGVTGGDTLPEGIEEAWIEALVTDLQNNTGASIVIAGEQQPPVVHALAHAINDVLGNVGQTVVYTDPVEANTTNQFGAMQTLVEEMSGGQVQLLVMMGGNPAYDAPVDIDFVTALGNVPLSVHYSLYRDETSVASTWHVPATHFLEMWGDGLAYDGTASIIQPLIAPLYGNRSPYEFVAALLGQTDQSNLAIVQAYWQEQSGASDFEQFWQTVLHAGVIADTALAPRDVSLQSGFASEAPTEVAGDFEVVFRPDPSTWDGSYANNGWMQELPRSLTKVVWDNPAMISPTTASSLGVVNGDLVEISNGDRQLSVPIWITPGHADNTVTLTLGYGRTNAGRVGNDVGFNTYTLRTSAAPWVVTGVSVASTGGQYDLVSTQEHFRLEDESTGLDRTNVVRVATLAEFLENEDVIYEMGHAPEKTLYPEFEYTGYAWGMSIDLNACTGCNACTIACQAENNIPIVGKTEVALSREMHWIRIDRYYAGSLDNPAMYHQPLPCMHCENAPCEVVCPVAATVHDGEGLNAMIYNRCVGTKYCSNNCPYKVRRFNFLQYTDETTPVTQLQRNPNVTVRIRGVMEKCTYCTQRISAARIEAKKDNRRITDDDLQTACQQVCPTQAIAFGDLNNPDSAVAQQAEDPRHYGVLEDLITRPRTKYLGRLMNPNPDLETE